MTTKLSIAIVCSGPSVAGYLSTPFRHDLVIGVNRMGSMVACDWWVFNDYQVFGWYPPLRRPRIFSGDEAFRRIGELVGTKHRDRFEWLLHSRVSETPPSDHRWTQFSLIIAMVLADHLGAREIVIYGCDWKGRNDWDGRPPKGDARKGDGRHDYRWNNEKHRYGQVVKWLAERGVNVRRMPQDTAGGLEALTMAEKKTNGTGSESGEQGTSRKATPTETTAWVEKEIRLRRPVTIDGEIIAAGELVGRIAAAPRIGVNFLSRALEDGLCTAK